MSQHFDDFRREAETRLAALTEEADAGALDPAIDLLVEALDAGGVLQAFGTGHSEAFAMEIAGRAGGLIPTNRIALRDVVLRGSRSIDMLGGSGLERDPSVVDELFDLSPVGPNDVFLIASNSGVNGSIVGMALKVKETGHKLIAVTSIEHTEAVQPKHPSGKRLRDIADVVIDNKAPYGDATLTLGDTKVGAISSITAAFIAQLLTIGVTERMIAAGATPPVYLSANIPGGDDHNKALEDLYRDRISRTA
jgi:uncharacterized phosphosugar-binding protein